MDEKDIGRALKNLAGAMADDILSLSDDEIMAEALEDLGSQEAVDYAVARQSAIIENAIRTRKQKLGELVTAGLSRKC